jgi:hypothetical protein
LGQHVVAHKSGIRFPFMLAILLAVPQPAAATYGVSPGALELLTNAPSLTIIATCPPATVDVNPLPAGLMQLAVVSPCRKQENVRTLYAGIELIHTFNQAGELKTTIDCVAGDGFPLEVVFEDGTRSTVKVAALDLDRVTKVAVLWRPPVNLDLHAFEYAARPDSPGHIWAGAPSSASDAQARMIETNRGHGFMTTVSNGTEPGAKLEVYTFWRQADQKNGVISMALDYESRARRPQDPDTCGNGLYSEVRYETILFDRNISIKRQFGSLGTIDCNLQLDGFARYNNKTIPEITAKP